MCMVRVIVRVRCTVGQLGRSNFNNYISNNNYTVDSELLSGGTYQRRYNF